MEFLFSEIGLFAVFAVGSSLALGIAIGVALFLYAKDTVSNLSAYIRIKLKTHYQFQNTLDIEGRQCQVKRIDFTEVEIIDVDTQKTRTMSTREFRDLTVWRNPPRREAWTQAERDERNRMEKDRLKNNA